MALIVDQTSEEHSLNCLKGQLQNLVKGGIQSGKVRMQPLVLVSSVRSDSRQWS